VVTNTNPAPPNPHPRAPRGKRRSAAPTGWSRIVVATTVVTAVADLLGFTHSAAYLVGRGLVLVAVLGALFSRSERWVVDQRVGDTTGSRPDDDHRPSRPPRHQATHVGPEDDRPLRPLGGRALRVGRAPQGRCGPVRGRRKHPRPGAPARWRADPSPPRMATGGLSPQSHDGGRVRADDRTRQG